MFSIPIFLSSDNNYAPFVATTIASICDNTNSFCDFYVLDGGIVEENKQKICKLEKIFPNFSIEFIKIDLFNQLKSIEYKNNCPHVSISTYNRFLINKVKPLLNKIIYLDVDVIVCGDIKNLYDIDLKNYALGAVPENFDDSFGIEQNKKNLGISIEHKYFNAGVLLIDNQKLKYDNLFKIEEEYRPRLKYADQDVLNIAHDNNYLILPEKYNYMSQKKENCHDFVIRHFNTDLKPWQLNLDLINTDIFINNVELFWKYAKITSFYDFLYSMVNDKEQQNSLFRKQRISLMMKKGVR